MNKRFQVTADENGNANVIDTESNNAIVFATTNKLNAYKQAKKLNVQDIEQVVDDILGNKQVAMAESQITNIDEVLEVEQEVDETEVEQEVDETEVEQEVVITGFDEDVIEEVEEVVLTDEVELLDENLEEVIDDMIDEDAEKDSYIGFEIDVIQLILNRKFNGASKRAKMKFLATKGLTITKIAKVINVRYQQVYNTLKGNEETIKPAGAVLCKICGKVLTAERSIEAGMGPICEGKHGSVASDDQDDVDE